MDASHFVTGGFVWTLWSRVRCFVKTAISAEQAVMLMTRLLAGYKDKTLAPVLDNAAYQRCGKVTDFAKEHGIGLIFLPPY
jgi:transposase